MCFLYQCFECEYSQIKRPQITRSTCIVIKIILINFLVIFYSIYFLINMFKIGTRNAWTRWGHNSGNGWIIQRRTTRTQMSEFLLLSLITLDSGFQKLFVNHLRSAKIHKCNLFFCFNLLQGCTTQDPWRAKFFLFIFKGQSLHGFTHKKMFFK
jgi:hypothetical protein